MRKKIDELKDKLFDKVHGNQLIYNTCWEDPRLDREIMQLDENSEVVMITSAGCNALDYVLDNPSAIHCVDLNFRQNALLELKKALFTYCDYYDLFEFFGIGYSPNASKIYTKNIRKQLSKESMNFWDENIKSFTHKNPDKTFYFTGTSGSFAWLFKKYLDNKKSRKRLIDALLDSKDLKEQEYIYEELEPKLFNKIVNWVMKRHVTMSLLGVPRAQRQLIFDQFDDGMSGYLKDNLRHVFTKLSIKDNYFWRLYLKGSYTVDCCPEYLKFENHKRLVKRNHKIKTYTASITEFLKNNPKQYSHFVLLDHQDWMSHNMPKELEEEWEYILKNSKKGTKIILRSAGSKINFLPKFVKKKVAFKFMHKETLHLEDRVGTYGCTYIGEVL